MGTWKQIAALPNARSDGAAVFHDGKVHHFGGYAGGASFPFYLADHYVYNPDGNTWSTAAPLPTTGIVYAFSTATDGIHVIYPRTGVHYAYDATADTWSTRLAVPATTRNSAHHFTDASGLIYMAGGDDAGSVHRYNPTTNTWTARAAMPSALRSRGANISPGVLGSDNKVYLGWGSFTTGLMAYDPATDTWSTTSAAPDTKAASFTVSRTPFGVVLTLPHISFSGSGSNPVPFKRIDGYAPATGTWTMGAIPNFPGGSWESAVATEPGGLVYLIGGTRSDPSSGADIATAESWSYKQNEPPTAPTPRTLVGGVTVSTASANRASWTFNDPNVGDSQSKYNFYYRATGTTTWTTVTKTTPNPWYDFPAGDLDPVEYEWQVETYDAAGEISPRTTSAIFTAIDPPDGPSITEPINGQTVEQITTVTWSAPAQDAYQLRRVKDVTGAADTGTVYFDTGEVAEPLTRTLQVTFDVNDRFEHVQVRVKKSGLWSTWVDVQVDVSYTPPPTPTFVVYPDASTGSLLLMISNPEPDVGDPAAAYNDVYVDDGNGEERKVTALATNTGWRYWTPKSGRDYVDSIRVVAVAANGTTAST